MRKFTSLTLVGFGLLVPGMVHAQTAIVPAFRCSVILGGSATVPAGSEVVVLQRWGAMTKGLVQDFLNAQRTTIVVNGGAPIDVSNEYVPIASAPDGSYFTRVLKSTGVFVGGGDSMTFTLTIELAHMVHDGFTVEDESSRRKLFFGPGVAFEFPCTVTGS